MKIQEPGPDIFQTLSSMMSTDSWLIRGWKTRSPVRFQTSSSMFSAYSWSIRKTFNSTLYFYHGYDALRHVPFSLQIRG